VNTQREARLIEANEEAQRIADRWMQRAGRAEAEVERLREEVKDLRKLLIDLHGYSEEELNER
jgi:predicted O-methyltransferase YrrM